MSLVTKIKARLTALLTATADHGVPQASLDLDASFDMASGTGSGQANQVFSDQRTITASSSEELDLSGVLANVLGTTIAFTAVKAIFIRAAAANVNNVVVGNAAATQFLGGFAAAGNTWAIPPGGIMMVTAPAAGWTVANAASDKLKIANSGAGTSVVYDIIVIGIG
jgi:hypothetical protein